MAEPSIQEKVGARVRELCRSRGWTLEQLAERADRHYTYIGGLERADRNVTLEVLHAVATALEVPLPRLCESKSLQHPLVGHVVHELAIPDDFGVHHFLPARRQGDRLFHDMPIQQNDAASKNEALGETQRKKLRRIAPSRANCKISFPDHYEKGRIVVMPGSRLLDWEGGEWVPYEKEGVRWYREEFTEADYIALRRALSARK